MIRKKFMAGMLVVTMVATLMAGCSKKTTTEPTVETTPAVQTTQAAENTTTQAPSAEQSTTEASAETTAPEIETTTVEGEIVESDTAGIETNAAGSASAPVVIPDFSQFSTANSLVPTGATVKSFLTGESISDKIAYRRPLAVMQNNIQGGLPQRGISKASIIVEGQCEGNITRLMCVYQDYDSVDSIGSIRSCRDYFPFMAAEYDAAYFHFGQSDFALEFLSDPNLLAFSGMTGMYNYVRRSDRVSPHNVFTTPADLVNAMVARGVPTYLDKTFTAPFVFNDSTTPKNVENGKVCNTLKTGYAYNDAYFVYNANDGLYYRYQYGQPQIDEMTGEQVAVKNIILKLIPGEHYWNGSPLYLLCGTGVAYYISNGTASSILWSKEAQGVNNNLGVDYYYGYDPTRYYYREGGDIVLNQGKTWICLIENENLANIQILQ